MASTFWQDFTAWILLYTNEEMMKVLTSIESNSRVAMRLEEVARLLELQGANRYRVEAYRRGAITVRNLNEPINEFIDHAGIEGLQELPGIGPTLAQAIYHISRTGELPMLERMRGESDPVSLIATVPGIGQSLAKKIHEDLGIDSLEDLEAAAYDGRLRNIEALGEKRLAGIRQYSCNTARTDQETKNRRRYSKTYGS